MSRWLPYAVLVAVFALVAQLSPTNDAAWQLWIGRQLWHGAELYRDIVEVNPPLWFWIAVPVVAGADALGVSGWTALVGLLALSAAVSIALVQKIRPGLKFSLVLIFAFFATAISAAGQREQFTLIAVMPYIFLAAARAQRRDVPLPLAVSVALWAAVGLALKHYFALVPIALELWLVLKRGRRLSPEFLVICAAGILYGAAVVLLTPEYLRSMLPLIRQAYYVYNRPLADLLLLDPVLISALALAGFALLRRRSELVQALAIAGLAFIAAFLLQLKGFRYHGVPAIGVFSTMAIIALTELDFAAVRAKLAGLLFAVVPVAAVVTTTQGVLGPSAERDLICTIEPGSSVLVLTPFGDFAWPAVETCGLEWTSRYMFLWMLPAFGHDPGSPLIGPVRTALVADLVRYRPDVIVIQKDSRNGNALAFVMADPRFRAQLDHYKVVRSTPKLIELHRQANP